MPTDLFGRTTSYGLGTDGTFTYVWSDRDTGYAAAADSLYHVDGSKVVIPDTGGADWDSYVITGPTPAKLGSASFDIYFPSLSNPVVSNWFAPVILHLGWTDVTPFGDIQEVIIGLEQDYDYENDNAHVLFGPYDGAFDMDWTGHRVGPYSIPIELGNWYTAKVSYQIVGSGDLWSVLAGYKLWKTVDSEPTDYLIIHETNSNTTGFYWSFGDGYDGKPWFDLYYTGTAETYLDNLTFDSTAPTDLYRQRSVRSILTSPQVRTWTDAYDRTVALGPGSSYTFAPYTGVAGTDGVNSSFTTESQGTLSVNGSELVVTPAASVRTTAYVINTMSLPRTGWAQFDFKTPSSWSSGFSIRLIFGNDAFQYGVGVNSISGGTQWQLAFYSSATAASASLWTASANTWYTAKVFFDDTGAWQVLLKAQGAADTSAIVLSNEVQATSTSNSPQPWEIADARWHITTPATGNVVLIDNLNWLQQVGFTLDAVITADVTAFSVRSVIRRPDQPGSFTIDANLLAAFHSITANAVLRKTATGSRTIDAVLSPHHFNLDAFIVDGHLIRHFRDRDHSGVLLDTSVVLDQAVGPWSAGLTLREVLLDLWSWVEEKLE